MAIESLNPPTIPAIPEVVYNEYRQVYAVEEWNNPRGPLTTKITLRRCRRINAYTPDEYFEDLTNEQCDRINGNRQPNKPKVTTEITISVSDLFSAASQDPAIAMCLGAKMAAISSIVDALETGASSPAVII